MNSLGFMQGRLSPQVNGKIQAFPWKHWQNEFKIASENNFKIIEWTIDQERFLENPLMTEDGKAEIKRISKKYEVKIPSLTGDCFMESPFWKLYGKDRNARIKDFLKISKSCSDLGINIIVIPLVDGGSIEKTDQSKSLTEFLFEKENLFMEMGLKIIFESDFNPKKLKSFIKNFHPEVFGINYDIGNSASLDYNTKEELSAYGNGIYNVHIKDRVLFGSTVPLGEGNANLPLFFETLSKLDYCGNFILQTARSKNGQHLSDLIKYRILIEKLIKKYET